MRNKVKYKTSYGLGFVRIYASRPVLLLIAVMMLFAISGCGVDGSKDSKVEGVVNKTGTVQLYHTTDVSVEPDPERYQLMQPDNLSASLDEIIEKIQIQDKLRIDKYLIDGDRNVTLFISEVTPLTEEELLLNKAALIRSVTQLNIGNVILVVSDENGKQIEDATYTDASFYYYEVEKD